MASNHWKPTESLFSLAPGHRGPMTRGSPPSSTTSSIFGSSSSNNHFHQSSSFSNFSSANNDVGDRNNRSNNSSFFSEMPPIGHFSASSLSSPPSSNSNGLASAMSGNAIASAGPASAATNGGFREAGIVEKLLPSYGFIQCCERQARLFFHYSQFTGNIEHLKLGDPVEFEMTYDRRTGKPIASYVIKISSEAIIGEEISLSGEGGNGTISSGFITTEPSHNKEGRVAYENRGECFFLPFTKDDLSDPALLYTIKANDKVTFKIATDKSGNLRAKNIALLSPFPDRYQGIVCTLKDSFGFIERSDVVKEIFFHSSECNDFKNLLLGDDVEFSIQTRNDKKVAVSVRRLPAGSVVFEELSKERLTGQVIKLCDRLGSGRSFMQQQFGINVQTSSSFFNGDSNSLSMPGNTNATNGLIRYQSGSMEQEIKFGEKDIVGEFTLQSGDWVTFSICTDKRDGAKRAGKLQLHEDFSTLTGEAREQGYIASLKDNYGFIKCLNSEGTRVYFKLTEIVEPGVIINQNDEVEFTPQVDNSTIPGRVQAIRIKTLPNGTIMNNLLNPKNQPRSSLDRAPGSGLNGSSSSRYQQQSYSYTDPEPLIKFDDDVSSKTEASNFSASAPPPKVVARDSWIDILAQMPITVETSNTNGNGNETLPSSMYDDPRPAHPKNGTKILGRGFVAALKDSYGFIENEDRQTEVFFHFSVFDGNVQNIDLGQAVEYTASVKGSKQSADYVKTIAGDEFLKEDILPEVSNGLVVRSVRCFNPDQDVYTGMIKVNTNGENGASDGLSDPVPNSYLEFSMTSLADIHDFVQKNDIVTFQVAVDKKTGRKRAVNVKPIRNKHKATVDAIKGSYGFLNFETQDDGKKLFFHMSEFQGNDTLNPGDTVEFTVVYNQRSNKHSACTLTRCKSDQQITSQRPDYLISKIKQKPSSKIDIAKIVLTRQPRAPDGTKGFSLTRTSPSMTMKSLWDDVPSIYA